MASVQEAVRGPELGMGRAGAGGPRWVGSGPCYFLTDWPEAKPGPRGALSLLLCVFLMDTAIPTLQGGLKGNNSWT